MEEGYNGEFAQKLIEAVETFASLRARGSGFPFSSRVNSTYGRPYDLAPYQLFIDARSGKLYSKHTEVYWNKLDSFIEAYIDHPESKFENGNLSGTMRRRHISVTGDEIAYIGKESNELERPRHRY
jgi:hypothetical protein